MDVVGELLTEQLGSNLKVVYSVNVDTYADDDIDFFTFTDADSFDHIHSEMFFDSCQI